MNNLKFELNDNEMSSARKVKECVEYLYGEGSIDQIQYLFSSGGGVGPFGVNMLVTLKSGILIKKDITDYQSW
jgi:hypothetical protein